MKLITFLLLFVSQIAFSSIIRDIDSASDDNRTFTTISFDSEYKGKHSLKNEGSFIEIVLPNVTVEQPGVFYDAKSPFFTKIAPFQLNNNDAAIRFFVKENKLHIEKAIKVSISKDTMVIELDHKLASNKSDLSDKSMPSANEVISSTAVRKNIEDPAKNIIAKSTPVKESSKKIASDESPKSTLLSYKKHLNLIAGLVAVGMFLFLGFSFYKNRSGEVTDLLDVSKDNIKTLATYSLTQKQQLKLVEVAGEKILLGVSGDNISYLKTLEDDANKFEANNLSNQRVVERSPLQLEKRENKVQRKPDPVSHPAPTASLKKPKNRSVSNYGKATDADAESNIAMKMLSKQNTDFSDERNVEISSKRKGATTKEAMASSEKSSRNDKAVEDVTKLIRKKLQNLPKV